VVLVKAEQETPVSESPVVKMREKRPTSTPSPTAAAGGMLFQGMLQRKSTLLSPVKKASNRLEDDLPATSCSTPAF